MRDSPGSSEVKEPGTVSTRGLLDQTPAPAVMGAFAAVVLAFVAATAYSESASSLINSAALSIATNAAPSVEHLAEIRGGLRQLLVAEDEFVDMIVAGRSTSPGSLLASRTELERDLHAYRSLPAYPGEEQAWNESGRELNLLDRTLSELISAASQGPDKLRVADLRFRTQVAAAAQALTRNLRINADMAAHLAETIERVSQRRRRLVFGLDLVCAMATLGAALLVLRLLRRHRRLARAYEHTLERRADEMEAFAGRVSHDVRNALAPVAFSLSRLTRANLAEQPIRWVATADRGVRRLFDLVDGLLAFARAGAQRVPGQTADLASVIQDVISAQRGAAEESRCSLCVGGIVSCQVPCNVGVLTSLVANLVANAIKHIGDGDVRRIEIGAAQCGTMVRVTVADTGPGVPVHLRDAIFDPFVKAGTAPGVGLGLATVRRLAEGHGGRAGMDPAPAGGSRFWFELPAIPPPDQASIDGGASEIPIRADDNGPDFQPTRLG